MRFMHWLINIFILDEKAGLAFFLNEKNNNFMKLRIFYYSTAISRLVLHLQTVNSN